MGTILPDARARPPVDGGDKVLDPGRSSIARTVFWALLGLGALVRLAYYLQIRNSFLFQTPLLDAKYYHAWAMEIARGDLLGRARGVFTMSPGYSYFLALVYSIFGVEAPAVVVLQFISGLASGALVYAVARKYFSKPAALTAMALYLFYAPAMFYESTLLKASLVNLLNLAALYLVLAGGPALLALSGILIGASTQLRPNVLLFVPIVVLYVASQRQRALPGLVAFGSGLLLALAPVAARNYAVGNEFVLTTAHGGMNFFTGNSPYCLGPYTRLPFARSNPAYEYHDFLEQSRKMSGKNLTPAESSNFWVNESLNYIRANPAAWIKLLYRKILIFTNDYEPPINLDFSFFVQEYHSVLSSNPITYGIVFPLAMIGIVINGASLLLGGYLLVFLLSGIVFFVASEYRFPIVPVLCVYAGAGVTGVFRKLKDHKTSELLPLAGLLLVFAALSNYDVYANTFGFGNYKRAHLANSYFSMGELHEEKGNGEEAKRSYEKAIDVMPLAAPMINLARLWWRENNVALALKLNEDALRADPGSAEAAYNIGALLFMKRDYGSAAEYFKAALARKPDFPEAQNSLALVLSASGSK